MTCHNKLLIIDISSVCANSLTRDFQGIFTVHTHLTIVIHDKSLTLITISPFKFWLLDMAFVHDISMHVCVCLSVCLCVHPSGQWRDVEPF